MVHGLLLRSRSMTRNKYPAWASREFCFNASAASCPACSKSPASNAVTARSNVVASAFAGALAAAVGGGVLNTHGTSASAGAPNRQPSNSSLTGWKVLKMACAFAMPSERRVARLSAGASRCCRVRSSNRLNTCAWAPRKNARGAAYSSTGKRSLWTGPSPAMAKPVRCDASCRASSASGE